MEASTIVTLKKGEGRALKAGGAWVYDNEIETITGRFKNGSVVTVHDNNGYGLGKGFINQNSTIRIRMLTRNPDTVIDDAFIRMRVENAWKYRKEVLSAADLDACRIIFGEADWLPGLTVDKYNDVLVVESLALGMDRLKEIVIDALKDILSKDGYNIKGVYERSDAPVRKKEGMPLHKGFIGPEFDTDVVGVAVAGGPETAVVVEIGLRDRAHLLEVVHAADSTGFRAGLAQRGQQHGGQDGDNGDNNKQLNERKYFLHDLPFEFLTVMTHKNNKSKI